MKTTNLLFAFLFSFTLAAQDTLFVQGFNYNSTTRDSVIIFPIDDHNQYEKILMFYSMRCKDGLVSTGSDRNRGCGEWDYSCNTSIIDSSRIDSLITAHPSHVIPGFGGNSFEYTTQPVYIYYLRDLHQTNINTVNSESSATLGSEEIATVSLFDQQAVNKAYFLIHEEELSGYNESKLSALSFDLTGELEDVDFLGIRLASTTQEEIVLSQLPLEDLEEVFHNHVNKEDLDQPLYFYKDFDLNPGENVLVELTYTSHARSQSITASASSYAENRFAYHEGNDGYIDFNNSTAEIPTEGMDRIQNEITFAFWANGNEDVLPRNTSMVYAEDDANRRQLNIHLPWSNGIVYFDCGNNGSGYDRVQKQAEAEDFRGKWTHWAFTKNAVTGSMKVYLNGELWLGDSGKFHPIDMTSFLLGSGPNGNNAYPGLLDDVVLYDRALSADEIRQLMHERPNPNQSSYANLIRFFDFNEEDDLMINDQSPYQAHGTFERSVRRRTFRGSDIFKDFTYSTIRPNLSVLGGSYDRNTTIETITDSIKTFPFEVIPYSVEGSDLVQGTSLFYWQAGDTYVYDQNGDIYEFLEIEDEGRINISDIFYFRKRPAKFELLSFVTPYGIGLDFGMEGRTWVFDVTDFGPILKGNKRLLMDRGGQWQEDMDIQFAFIEGTPTRPVLDIHQVWPVESNGYTSILDNRRLEPRELPLEDNVKEIKLRIATTGHGQEGEFIPRTHWVNIDTERAYEWSNWKECAFNPVYPQGGTWVYDRAGWCPGEATFLHEYDFMHEVDGQDKFSIDYGLNTASGNSNYIVNVQVAKYGEANFNRDAEIMRIMAPTDYIEDLRLNPTCTNPRVLIKNNGTSTINTVRFAYGVEGETRQFYTWSGSLDYLSKTEVEFPQLPNAQWARGNRFYVEITHVNGQEDEYAANNRVTSKYETVPHINGDIVISVLTNNAANETRWQLLDEAGNEVISYTGNLSPNTRYTDTLSNLNGCYTLKVTDSGEDGLSWWANNDGNGFLRIRGGSSSWIRLQTDFGGEITYSFTTGQVVDIEEKTIDEAQINIFPNPSQGRFVIETEGLSDLYLSVYNQLGQVVKSSSRYEVNSAYDEIELDLTNEMNGVYYVLIDSAEGRSTRKIIKQ